ncbi:MAG: hypothetical protein IV100_12635 [Myxococcales bacterium]|uniref:hypothetical protein n=1 Tax=Sediminibacterium sp. TaxID=1917865 RepID=UPI001D2D86DF|nr:hypothetical protein [Sediminibacterium sp.]MBT9485845.1 hypothetical protein [Sediminibacterium sp.]MBT9556873.1 hypothetical protein [Myxococcales bacterium]
MSTPLAALTPRAAWSELALGVDMAFGHDLVIGEGGDAELVGGGDCLAQDLVHRLETPKGSYLIDPEFGSKLHDFLHGPMDAMHLAAVALEVRSTCETDPRVAAAHCQARLTSDSYVELAVSVEVFDERNPLNLVIGWDLSSLTLEVIRGRA